MPHYYQDIYQLAAKLIQNRNKGEILKVFKEELARLLPGLRIELYESGQPRERFQHIFTIGTADNSFGVVAIEGQLENDTAEHLANAARLVAIRLENIDQQEQSGNKNEKRLSTLLANLPGMAYQCYNDKRWTMLFLSQGCKSLTEYEPSILKQDSALSYGDLILPDDRTYVWDTVQQNLENRQPFTVTYRIKTRSGCIKWVWERGRCIKEDHQGNKILEGFISDITQQKQAEYRLKQNLARFKALINNLQSGVLVEDYSRKIINANQKLSDLFGAPNPEAMLGQDCGSAAKQISGLFIDPDYFIGRIEEILENREIVINEELYLKDGRTFERDYVPVFIEDTFSGNMWIYRDITHQKEHEQAIKNSLEEKKTLLKEIHHRVKNNLSVITSLLKLQSATLPEEDQAQKALEETYNQIHSMAQVHEQLYQSDNFNSVDMYLYVESLISRLSQSYPPSANINFQLKADHVSLDINRAIPCGLILNELITNSLKHAFTESNAGTVRINMTKSNADYLYIGVEDDGIGLPDNFNIEEVETLGLELVNMLIRQLDATLEVENSEGVAIEMYIPLR